MRFHVSLEKLGFLTLSLTVGLAHAQTTTLDSVTAKAKLPATKPAPKAAPRAKEPILPLPEKKLSAVNADKAAIRPATLQKAPEPVAPLELAPAPQTVAVDPVVIEPKIAPTSAAASSSQAAAAGSGSAAAAQSSSVAVAETPVVVAQAPVQSPAPSAVVIAESPVIFSSDSTDPTWLNFELSFVYSQWQKLAPGMSKGSLKYGVSVSRTVLPNFEAGLGVRSIRGGATNGNTEDIRSADALTLSGRYLFSPGKFTPYAGATLSIGRYTAWKALNETSSQITYDKKAGGTLAGISPAFGLVARLTAETRLTLAIEYDFYFGNSAKHVGGVAAASSLGITF